MSAGREALAAVEQAKQLLANFRDVTFYPDVDKLQATIAGLDDVAALLMTTPPPAPTALSAHDHGNCALCDEIEVRFTALADAVLAVRPLVGGVSGAFYCRMCYQDTPADGSFTPWEDTPHKPGCPVPLARAAREGGADAGR